MFWIPILILAYLFFRGRALKSKLMKRRFSLKRDKEKE